MMQLKRLTEGVYACLQEDITGWGYNNTGFIKKGGGLVIDSMWDLKFTQEMIDLFCSVSPPPYGYLVNTHANGDHCWGNQLFENAEIVGHPTCADFSVQAIASLQGFIDQRIIHEHFRFVAFKLTLANQP